MTISQIAVSNQSEGTRDERSEVPLSSVPYLPNDVFALVLYADVAVMSAMGNAPSDDIENQKNSHYAKRQAITVFSRKSRKRMIETMAKIRGDCNGMKFITLTYRDEEYFGDSLDPSDFQAHLNTFMEEIERFFPNAGIIWRKEYKPRKSGDFAGKIAPHAHLIVKDFIQNDETALEWVSKRWSRITGAGGRDALARVDVQTAKNRKHAYSYLSKYVAKVDDENETEISEFFHNHKGKIGRHWGVRGNFDLSEGLTITLSYDEAIDLKRMIRSWLKSKKKQAFAKVMTKIPDCYGMTVLGVGDESEGRERLIRRMIEFLRR